VSPRLRVDLVPCPPSSETSAANTAQLAGDPSLTTHDEESRLAPDRKEGVIAPVI
jgi:hypothetical protein